MEKDRQARDRLIMGRLIDALPEAVIVIGAAERVVAVRLRGSGTGDVDRTGAGRKIF